MLNITVHKKVLDFFQRFGPLSVPVFTLAFALTIWAIARLTLIALNATHIQFSLDMLQMIPNSIRFDILIFSYLWGLFIVLYLSTPKRFLPVMNRYAWKPIFSGLTGLIIYLEMATIPFVFEYGNRLDRISVEYLKYPKEVFSMLSKHYKTEVFLSAVITIVVLRLFWNSYGYVADQYVKSEKRQHILLKAVMILFVAAAIVLGGRSSLGHRPANISSASFSTQHIVNELTLNSTYTVLYDLYRMRHESNPYDVYPDMEDADVYRLVKEFSATDGKVFRDDPMSIINTLAHPNAQNKPKYNLVIVLEESLGSDYVGRQGGVDVSPEIDRISQDGIFFDQLYATGTRTVRGLEASITGFMPTPGASVVKLSQSKRDFWTMATYLKQFGYKSFFLYGGDTNFDEMKAFFMGNGFDEVHDLTNIEGDYEVGSWGIHDEDVFAIGHKLLLEKSAADEPFFALILSTSNHSPFDYPAEKIELHPDFPKESHENAIKYSDYALGTFYDAAKSSPYFDDTIFLFAADHNTRVKGHDLIPVHKFRIPGMLIGPNIPKMTYTKVCSNIDFLPTILHYMQLEGETPMLGRDLMSLPEDDPGRAIMQYGKTFGFRLGDDVSIIRPYADIVNFEYDGMTLHEKPFNAKLNELALAHALIPWMIYSTRSYNVDLPAASTE